MGPKSGEGSDKRGRVLSPEELDFTVNESVIELEDGRFVISPGGKPTVQPDEPRFERVEAEEGSISEEAIQNWHFDRFDRGDSRYGYVVYGKFDDKNTIHRLSSNDIITMFEQLIVWFGKSVDDESPVEKVLEILLTEATLPVSYSILKILEEHDLEQSDSIESLIKAANTGYTIDNSGDEF